VCTKVSNDLLQRYQDYCNSVRCGTPQHTTLIVSNRTHSLVRSFRYRFVPVPQSFVGSFTGCRSAHVSISSSALSRSCSEPSTLAYLASDIQYRQPLRMFRFGNTIVLHRPHVGPIIGLLPILFLEYYGAQTPMIFVLYVLYVLSLILHGLKILLITDTWCFLKKLRALCHGLMLSCIHLSLCYCAVFISFSLGVA